MMFPMIVLSYEPHDRVHIADGGRTDRGTWSIFGPELTLTSTRNYYFTYSSYLSLVTDAISV